MSSSSSSSQLDVGLCTGNYFDYANDDVARQREYDMATDVIEGNRFIDSAFPTDARSLYYDPLNPPKGALPGEAVRWCCLCKGEVLGFEVPTLFNDDGKLPHLVQGALGDSYFVNAMRLLACQPHYLKRLIVSSQYASIGLYTLKFCKAGKWRYVHIDDRIPCRPSGTPNFCRNLTPNETFGMLIEKGYAKLHGCYEAIAYGCIDKVIQDLTPAAHCQLGSNGDYNLDTVVDSIWEILSNGKSNNCNMGCGRWLADPYGESAADRFGITLGMIYSVEDVTVASSDATEELDALTVGMVCVRNLNSMGGVFTGRWCYGDQLWTQYPEISTNLLHKTREIRFRRGLGPDPNDKDSVFDDNEKNDSEDNGDEPDTPLLSSNRRGHHIPQPNIGDMQWIQIEDFVDVFNRVYVTYDLSWLEKPSSKRFCSRWIPGDFIVGSGGPPVILPKLIDLSASVVTEQTSNTNEDKDREVDIRRRRNNVQVDRENRSLDQEVTIATITNTTTEPNIVNETKPSNILENQPFTTETDGFTAVSVELNNTTSGFVNVTDEQAFSNEQLENDEYGLETDLTNADGGVPLDEQEPSIFSIQKSSILDGDDEYEDDEDKADTVIGHYRGVKTIKSALSGFDDEIMLDSDGGPMLMINDDFTDNPMYPFSVTEPTTLVISMFQEDRRWSVGRLGDEPRDITTTSFSTRSRRLAACMRYPDAVGFAILKLNGMKVRITEFKLKKISGGSDKTDFSNVASTAIIFPRPGRFVIVPFTSQKLTQAKDYILHCTFGDGCVEFEVNDVIAERLMDQVVSDDDEDDDDGFEDEEEEEEQDDQAVFKPLKPSRYDKVPPPKLYLPPSWVYSESTEERGIVSVYDEVGDLCKYMDSIRKEIRNIRISMIELKELGQEISSQKAEMKKAETSSTTGKPTSKSGSRGSPMRRQSTLTS